MVLGCDISSGSFAQGIATCFALSHLCSASVGAEHVPLAHSILVRKVVWKKLEKFSGYPADHAVFSGDQRDPAHDPLIFQGDF